MSPDDDSAIFSLLREAALGRSFTPPADVYSTERRVVITVELPGVAENAVVIDADGARLSVRGRRAFVAADSVDYFRLERTYGDFQCSVALPSGSKPERRTSSWADGVLTVVVPREER